MSIRISLCVVIALLFMHLSNSIEIPLSQGQFRCMLIYSMFNNETVKIDINFPRIMNWQQGDKYYLTLRNTKTDHTENEEIKFGHFRRQITIYQRIIYEICFEFLSPRQVTQQIVIDYEADTHYMVDKDKLKLPQNLLKQQNLAATFNNALNLNKMASHLIQMQKQRSMREEIQFQQTEHIQHKIMVISIIEICVILGISIFQFCKIREKLQGSSVTNYI